MKKHKRITFLRCMLLSIILGAFIFPGGGQACTLWAAAGERVSGGGTLIAKNRDRKPNHRQVLRLGKTSGGRFRYFGLFVDGNNSGVKAGINEHGLVVVSATSPFPSKQRRKMPRTFSLNRKILAHCRSVKDALTRRSWFLGPRFLLLADRHHIALVEIAPQRKLDIQISENGKLYHTNHYLDPRFRQFNSYKKNTSSRKRFERIGRFMSRQPHYSMKDFITISASTEGGPNNSIWRKGRRPTSTRTLASWIVRLPLSGDPQIYVKLANPDEDIREYHLNAAALFNP